MTFQELKDGPALAKDWTEFRRVTDSYLEACALAEKAGTEVGREHWLEAARQKRERLEELRRKKPAD